MQRNEWNRAALGLSLALGIATASAAADLSAPIKGSDGKTLGEVQVSGAPTGVLLQVSVEGLEPGWHGIHLHAKGDCGSSDFKSAGGHINHETKKPHGLLNTDGPDMGDLPNLYIGKDGTGKAEFFSTLVALEQPAGDRPALLDEDGSALVIHAKPDDMTSQPIGGAGDRVACAVIEKGS